MHRTAQYGIAAHWRYKEGKQREASRPRVARPDDGVAEGHGRPSRVHGGAQDRPVGWTGVRVHPQGRRHEPATGRDPGGLRVHDPHRGRPPHDRRQGQRQTRPARLRTPHGRLGGDLDVEGTGRRAEPGLAAVRRDASRAEQDPTVVRPWASRGRAGSGPRPAPAADAQAEPAVQTAGDRGGLRTGRRRPHVPGPRFALRRGGGGTCLAAVGGGAPGTPCERHERGGRHRRCAVGQAGADRAAGRRLARGHGQGPAATFGSSSVAAARRSPATRSSASSRADKG